MGVLELRDVTLGARRQAHPQEPDRRLLGRPGSRAHRAERRRQVHLGEHDHGPSRVPAHSGDILFDGEPLRASGRRAGAPGHHARLAGAGPVRGPADGQFIARRRQDKSPDVARVLRRVGLDPERYFTRKVDKTLSGGERKRVELASILAMEPRVVLMDEPDSGIDVEALQRIFDALADFRARGATVIMITHSMAVLEHAEHAFLLCDGHILDKGTVGRSAATSPTTASPATTRTSRCRKRRG